MIEKKRMQQRYGSQAEFEENKDKLLPNEFAVVTSGADTKDGTALYLKIGDNEPKRIDNIIDSVLNADSTNAINSKAIINYLKTYPYLYWDDSHNIFDFAPTTILNNTSFTNQDDTKDNKYLVCLPARVTEIKSGTFKYPNNIIQFNCEGDPTKIKIADEYKQIEIRQLNLGDRYKLNTLVDLGKTKADKDYVDKKLDKKESTRNKVDGFDVNSVSHDMYPSLNALVDMYDKYILPLNNSKADKTDVYTKDEANKTFEKVINKVNEVNFQFSDDLLKSEYVSGYALKFYNEQYVTPIQDELAQLEETVNGANTILENRLNGGETV